MSLLNFSCTPDRVLLAVDTLAGFRDGARYDVSKLVPVLHANVILAGRGSISFIHAAVGHCLGRIWPSLDILLSGAEGLLQEARSVQHADCVLSNEFVIAGWSDERQRMIVRRFIVAQDGSIDALDGMAWRLAPGECFTGSAAQPPTDIASMKAAAQAQVRWVHENWPTTELGAVMGGEPIIGGRLLVAELTRDRLTVDVVELEQDAAVESRG